MLESSTLNQSVQCTLDSLARHMDFLRAELDKSTGSLRFRELREICEGIESCAKAIESLQKVIIT